MTSLAKLRHRRKRWGPIRVGCRSAVARVIQTLADNEISEPFASDAGWHLLQRLGTLVREAFRPSDVIGRLGGEEFGIILPQVDAREATAALDRFRETVRRMTVRHEAHVIGITVSCGVCLRVSCWRR